MVTASRCRLALHSADDMEANKTKRERENMPPVGKDVGQVFNCTFWRYINETEKNDPGIAYLFGLTTQRQSNWRLLIAKCNLTVTFNYPFSISQISSGKCNPVLLMRSPEIKLPFL